MYKTNFCLANISFSITHFNPFFREFAKEYLIPDTSSIDVEFQITKNELNQELSNTHLTPPVCECILILQKIAEYLPNFHASILHGVALSVNSGSCGVLLTAPSTGGKTTQALSICSLIPHTTILNGDKPILVKEDSQFYLYSTPWMGKEQYGFRGKIPLHLICYIEKGTHSYIEPMTKEDKLQMLIETFYCPQTEYLQLEARRLLSSVLQEIPCVYCSCTLQNDFPQLLNTYLK